MKLQTASKKELSRIAAGTVTGTALLILVLWLLSLVGVGSFEPSRIFLGAGIGCLIAVFNFYLLCLTVQKAVDISDQKQMKMKFQVSYNFRMLLQAAWVVVALLVPQIHVVAGAVPLLFPHAVIIFLQMTGRIAGKPRKGSQEPSAE